MNKLAAKCLIILLLLTGSVGFSTLLTAPVVPNILSTCVKEKAPHTITLDYSEQAVASIYNDCSILPHSLAIVVAGLGLFGLLILLRELKIIELELLGILLIATLFTMLELAFYAFFQYKFFYDSQLAQSALHVLRNYLFAFSSLGSLLISLLLVPKLMGERLFNKD